VASVLHYLKNGRGSNKFGKFQRSNMTKDAIKDPERALETEFFHRMDEKRLA
jgi:hypothetical protein